MMINTNRKRPLRVAHITHGFDMGGLEKLLVEFARHADRERFDLRFVSLGARGTLADEIEALGWPVTALEVPSGLRPGLILRLAWLFRHWGIDVVHTHDERPLIYGATAARVARIPTVLHTRHGRSSGLTRRLAALMRFVGNFTDSFLCVSEDSARLSMEQGIDARRVGTIWNGIDLDQFHYTGPCAGGPAVIVARLSPEKDIATLLRATALAMRDQPSFRLEIAGDGISMPALRQLAAELGLDNHVRFLGQVRDVPAVLARAGLFVLSSVSEGISLTLLEAMANGLPVVATRVGGNPEVVEDGATGLLVPSGDPAALAKAMLYLHRDPQESQRLGRAGRDRVERYFDIRRMVAAYERHYQGSPGSCSDTSANAASEAVVSMKS